MKIVHFVALAFGLVAMAHPGHQEPEHELIAKRNFKLHARRGLEKCAPHIQKRGIDARAKQRRAATYQKYRKVKSGKRDTDSILATSHLSNASYSSSTSESTIFESSTTCVLNPEGEVGPYWVPGEQLRSNLRENETGVPVVLEGQFLDIETCEPLTDIWWDLWNCNATGVYSGLVANGNGNSDDASNLNATFLRGIQQTDSEGVVTFETIFPGHYSGRTNHHHMVVHLDATVLSNNTLTAGTNAHVGQVFWDQDIIYDVEALYPYTENDAELTTNAEDRVFATETVDTTSDPVFEYAYLGDDLSDGLFGWVTIVVNTSATYDPSYSYVYTENGGVAQSGGEGGSGGDSGMGASGNGTTGNGTMPSGGAFPSGSIPASGSMPSGTAGGSATVSAVLSGSAATPTRSVSSTAIAKNETSGASTSGAHARFSRASSQRPSQASGCAFTA